MGKRKHVLERWRRKLDRRKVVADFSAQPYQRDPPVSRERRRAASVGRKFDRAMTEVRNAPLRSRFRPRLTPSASPADPRASFSAIWRLWNAFKVERWPMETIVAAGSARAIVR